MANHLLAVFLICCSYSIGAWFQNVQIHIKLLFYTRAALIAALLGGEAVGEGSQIHS